MAIGKATLSSLPGGVTGVAGKHMGWRTERCWGSLWVWFLLKGLQITLLFTKCVFSCHTESIEVRGHLVETGFPSITGDLDVRMAFPHWPWDVVFSLSYHLGTRLPSQQVWGWGSEWLPPLLERHFPSILSVCLSFSVLDNHSTTK